MVEALDEVGLHPPSLEYLAEKHADVADLIADITAHHRAYLETYHRNAKMMRVVEEVTNVSDSFRRERTARAQTWIEASRDAIGSSSASGAPIRGSTRSPRPAPCRSCSAARPT